MTANDGRVGECGSLRNVAHEFTDDGTDIDHELTDDCPCGPTSEAVKREDGSVGWVIIHHHFSGHGPGESPQHRPTIAPVERDDLVIGYRWVCSCGSEGKGWQRTEGLAGQAWSVHLARRSDV